VGLAVDGELRDLDGGREQERRVLEAKVAGRDVAALRVALEHGRDLPTLGRAHAERHGLRRARRDEAEQRGRIDVGIVRADPVRLDVDDFV
jgi:hypothetical protein